MKFLIITLFLITVSSVCGFNSCSTGESCIPHFKCEAITNITKTGILTQEQRTYLRSKSCNNINRLAYFCCEVNNLPVTPKHLPVAPKCGIFFENRVTKGEITSIEDFPWFALIQYSKPRNTIGHHCGGSLINERFVITAAHCVTEIKSTWTLSKVRLGEWNLTSNPDCEEYENEIDCNDPHVDIEVTKAIVHPNYISHNVNKLHDIALLKLERDVQFTTYIKPICLPLDPRVRKMDFSSSVLEVVGFGKTETERFSPLKLMATVNGLTQAECQAQYLNLQRTISKTQICAGTNDGRDSCNGDSGGPLMKQSIYPHSTFNHHMLVGIVSYGPKKCGKVGLSGVYTRVSEYMDWIINNTNPNLY